MQSDVAQFGIPEQTKLLAAIKASAKNLEDEINIIRSFSRRTQDELMSLRRSMADAAEQQHLLRDNNKKINELHNKLVMVSTEDMTNSVSLP